MLFGTYVSPQIALGGFHSASGWIGFLAVALSMVAVTRRMPFFAAGQSEVQRSAREGDPDGRLPGPADGPAGHHPGHPGVFQRQRVRLVLPGSRAGNGSRPLVLLAKPVDGFHWAGIWSGSAVAIGAAVFVVWLGLEWAMGFTEGPPALPAALAEMPAGMAAAWLIFRVLGSIITVPMAEELAFRGYALRRLVSPDFDKIPLRFTWLSFLLSSVLFGALHGRWLAGTVAGMFYAWAMYRRGKVGDAILAHATTNALIAADVLILGNWNLWN